MNSGKTFFRGRSQFDRHPRHQDRRYQDPGDTAAEAGAVPAAKQFGSLRASDKTCQVDVALNPAQPGVVARPQFGSSGKAQRRTIRTAAAGLMLKGVERCGHGADLVLANFPAGFLSWIFAQFFAGCAAYAEAMYPSIAFDTNEAGDGRELPHDGRAGRANSGRSPSFAPSLVPDSSLVPDLRELSGFDLEGREQRARLPVLGRTQPAAAGAFWTEKAVGTEKVVRLDLVRRSPAGRFSPIASLAAAWLSRRRRSASEGQIIVELRSHDRRALRGMRASRHSTE